MRYFLAIVFPPLAVLLCGKLISAILNFVLWCLGIIPGIIHGVLVVNSYKNKQNVKRIEHAIVASARVAHHDSNH